MDKPGTFGAVSVVSFAIDLALKVIDFKSAPLSVGLLMLAFGSGLYAVALLSQSSRPALYWRWDWPWWGRVPLDLAAALAFRRLDGTIWVRFALDQAGEEKRLDHMAKALAGEVKIYGRKRPGQHQIISDFSLAGGTIHQGGKVLNAWGNPTPMFEDLQIERSDLWWALKSMKRQTEEP